MLLHRTFSLSLDRQPLKTRACVAFEGLNDVPRNFRSQPPPQKKKKQKFLGPRIVLSSVNDKEFKYLIT